MNNIMFSNFQVKWKGDHQISPPRPFRHLIRTSMLTMLYFFQCVLKKSDSLTTPAIEAFRISFRPKKFQCSDSVSEIMETDTSDSD